MCWDVGILQYCTSQLLEGKTPQTRLLVETKRNTVCIPPHWGIQPQRPSTLFFYLSLYRPLRLAIVVPTSLNLNLKHQFLAFLCQNAFVLYPRGRVDVGHFVWEQPLYVFGFNSAAPVCCTMPGASNFSTGAAVVASIVVQYAQNTTGRYDMHSRTSLLSRC